MKKTFPLTLFLLAALCGWGQKSDFNCRLIPTPQQVVRTEGTRTDLYDFRDRFVVDNDTPKKAVKEILASGAPVEFCREVDPIEWKALKRSVEAGTIVFFMHKVDSIEGAQNQPQAYKLAITPDRIDITYTSDSGAWNAELTLRALSSIWNHNVPCMEITDWPAYEYRGWLDDVSRGPITNAEFSELQRNALEYMKMNFGSYYTEHSLYNPKYPDIVPMNGISFSYDYPPRNMMANLQCFAHFEKTLRIPYYQYMKDTRSNVNPAEPRTYEFLADQIANTMKVYSKSRWININCDETEGLGSGRARHYVDEVGADEAYCRHINKVYDLLKPYGKEVLMWGDIVGKDPAMLKKLPKEMQYIVWSYVAQESYAGMIAPFAKLHQEQGTQFWVAPGVSHWSSIPQVRNYMKNIAYLARDGYLAGARGLINTAWDDSGESLFGDCWHAMAWAAEMAWNPIKSTDPEQAAAEMAERERLFNENYDRWMATMSENPKADFTTEMIYHVGDLAGNRWVGDWFNTGALMQPLLEFYPSNVSDEMLTRCDSVDYILDQVIHHLDSATVPHFYYACHRIQRVSEKSRLRVMLHRGDPAAARFAQQYFQHLHQLKLEYLRLWDEEADAYSRDIICERYDRLGNEVLELDRKVLVETHGDTVALRTLLGSQPIYYTLDGRQPTAGSIRYEHPFVIDRSCLVKAVCCNEWDEPVYTERYLLRHAGMGHLKKLNTEYSSYNATYSAGGDNALADGCLGSDNSYADGHWQGYWGKDIDAVYDFGKAAKVNQVSLRFLQNTFDWILAPEQIEIYTSANGTDWKLVRTDQFHPELRLGGNIVRTNTLHNLGLTTRYLRVVAKNPGPLPEWHGSKGQPSYLFCDEIVIE